MYVSSSTTYITTNNNYMTEMQEIGMYTEK